MVYRKVRLTITLPRYMGYQRTVEEQEGDDVQKQADTSDDEDNYGIVDIYTPAQPGSC